MLPARHKSANCTAAAPNSAYSEQGNATTRSGTPEDLPRMNAKDTVSMGPAVTDGAWKRKEGADGPVPRPTKSTLAKRLGIGKLSLSIFARDPPKDQDLPMLDEKEVRKVESTKCTLTKMGQVNPPNTKPGLFDQPSKMDCVICMLPLPLFHFEYAYQPCCGQILCAGCIHQNAIVSAKNNLERKDKGFPQLDDTCPFCRVPIPDPYPSLELLERVQKRAALDDGEALKQLGFYYAGGEFGLPVDDDKSLELLHRAADLGNASACDQISHCYKEGSFGLPQDKARARHYAELAAMGGFVLARHSLGVEEWDRGELHLAVRHWKIAAAAGLKESADSLSMTFQKGLLGEKELAQTMKSKDESCKEMNSEQRDRCRAWLKKTGQYPESLGIEERCIRE